jgi:hypothetical protein
LHVGGHLIRCNALREMEDCRPSGIVLWGMVSNRHMLRWLKTVVVSDVEKARVMRQVGVRETNVSEPLLTRREFIGGIRTGWLEVSSGMSRAGAHVLARRCPACRRRDPDLRLS